MSGAYTHLAIANDARLQARHADLRDSTQAALGMHLKFVELGAVSPDYPYLSLHKGQARWADAMHHQHTATLLRTGVAAVHRMPPDARPVATAWLLGFAAHIATDMTIHPVVELKVGRYEGHESEHRRCEMHQDAHIFPRVMHLGDTGLSQHLQSGLATCHAPGDTGRLHPVVEQVWLQMLAAAYPDLSAEPPSPSVWHHGFCRVLSSMAGTNHLFPFSRHVSAALNLSYPREQDIDPQYIQGLKTPEGPLDFEPLYERARSNVVTMWERLDHALVNGRSDALDRLGDWDLDTGRSIETGELVFWENVA